MMPTYELAATITPRPDTTKSRTSKDRLRGSVVELTDQSEPVGEDDWETLAWSSWIRTPCFGG